MKTVVELNSRAINASKRLNSQETYSGGIRNYHKKQELYSNSHRDKALRSVRRSDTVIDTASDMFADK